MIGLIQGIEVASKVVSIADTILRAVSTICRELSVQDKNTKPEDLGSRCLIAKEEGIKLEDYAGRFDEYREKIDSIEPDPQRSIRYSPEEIKQAAMEYYVMGLVDHYNLSSGAEKFFGPEINTHSDFYTEPRIEAYLDAFRGGSVDKIGDYFDNKLDSMKEIKAVEAKLTEAEKTLGFSDKEAVENLDRETDRRSES